MRGLAELQSASEMSIHFGKREKEYTKQILRPNWLKVGMSSTS